MNTDFHFGVRNSTIVRLSPSIARYDADHITAKHGQSPIDTNRFVATKSTSPTHLLGAAGLLPASESAFTPGGIGPTEDDISQLWLVPGADVPTAAGILETNAAAAGIGQIFYGASLETMFNASGLPPNAPRTPDIIVQPNVGVVYTGSSKNVSSPDFQACTVTSFVETMRVAPTILQALGLDPGSLQNKNSLTVTSGACS